MSRFNTNNPIDSDDYRDGSDNLKTLDQVVNSSAVTTQNRLGAARRTLAGLEALVQQTLDPTALARLGDSDEGEGAALVAYGNETVEEALAQRLPEVVNYAAVRAGLGGLTAVYVRGRSNIFDGGAGVFRIKPGDTTTADVDGVVLVDVDGNRWFREDYEKHLDVRVFGAYNTGSDCTAGLLAARNYVASLQASGKQMPELQFPAGIYTYSQSPNWAIYDLRVRALGTVRMRCTGTGNAINFDAGAVATIYSIKWLGDFIVEAPPCAYGYFCRSIHHSRIEGRVDGVMTAGLRVEFAVCSEFAVRTTVNASGAWYGGARPVRGMHITGRGPGELTTMCKFSPLIEGVSGDGMYFDYAAMNVIDAGTSEANDVSGIVFTSNAVGNKIIGTDFEENDIADVVDYGSDNVLLGVNCTNIVNLYGVRARVVDSTLNSLVDDGTFTELRGVTYGMLGGTLSGSAVGQTRKNVFNAAGYYEQDKSYSDAIESAVVPSGVATSLLTLPTSGVSGNVTYDVTAYSPGVGSSYFASAVIYRDGATLHVISASPGENLSISISGLNVLVTQTSGISLTVQAKATAR